MTRDRRWLHLAALTIAVAVTSTPALAGIEGYALTITATNDAGESASIQIPAPAGLSDFGWSNDQPIEMRAPRTGNLIAVISPDGLPTSVDFVALHIIGLNWSVQAGPTGSNFFISSGLLTFPTTTAEGRATVGMSVSDFNGDGATLTGIGDPAGAEGAYLAQYNGLAALLLGTTFAEVIHTLAAGSFSSSTTNADVPAVGFLPIGPPVSDMSVYVSFSLTANDQASGTSTYVIQDRPVAVEPTTWAGVKALYR